MQLQQQQEQDCNSAEISSTYSLFYVQSFPADIRH